MEQSDPATLLEVTTNVTVREPAPDTVDDDFNDEATGVVPSEWTISTNGGSVTVQELPSASDKSARLVVTSTSSGDGMSRFVNSLSGPGITVEARVRRELTDRYFGLPFILDDNGVVAISIVFENGKIYAFSGGSKREITS